MKNKRIKSAMAASAIVALSTTAATAATTPYDLIRPTWPLTWDAKAMDNFDVTVTKKTGMLPDEKTPVNFLDGVLMPDTVDQAYLDVINTKISPIRVNQAGYLKSDKERQFYFVRAIVDSEDNVKIEEFEVVDENGKSLSPKVKGTFTSSGVTTASNWTIIAGTNAQTNDQKRYKVDFTGTSGNILIGNIPQSVPTDKRLRIKVGDEISSTFIVSEDVYTMVKDAAIKFFGIQRSGNSESWFHGASHTMDGSGPVVLSDKPVSDVLTNLKAGDLQGGWYDAGDHIKESQTQAFAFMSLAVMAATNPSKDVDHYAYNQRNFVNTDKIPDVLREAKHGADFFIRAYKAADGIVDNMAVSIGNFGNDHGFWGRPELQDMVTTTGRGGAAERSVRLGELGSNISGQIAAGLAILGKDYAKYDKDFASTCLTVAEKMYDFAKSLAQGKDTYDGDKPFVYNKEAAGWSTPAYSGNMEYFDDMALASVALLYATGKEMYLEDALKSKSIKGQNISECTGCFKGGWFATPDKAFLKNIKNTSWANSYTYALYALYKLILSDKEKALEFGLTEEERLQAIKNTLADMVANLSYVSSSTGTAMIKLPENSTLWAGNTLTYDPIWYSMLTDQKWEYNRYQVGNIFEVLAYADVAADMEKQGLGTNLESGKMFQLGINQLNYMLGVNPWDVSFIYGVGDKNDNHPCHRAANPEGRNTPALSYKYVRPVGGLFAGLSPDTENSWKPGSMSWEDFHLSDVILDASALLLSALTIVSNGGNDYYEKKCDNCSNAEASPFSNNMYASAYHYEFASLDYIHLEVVNGTITKQDSVVAYIYYDATEDDVKNCVATFDSDICQTYDMTGINKSCTDDRAIRTQLHKASYSPEKVEGSYNEETKTYTWAMPILLSTIDAGNRIRIDVSVSKGLSNGDGTCEILREPSTIKIKEAWSFTSHTAAKGAPAYNGAPTWEKDQGDIQEAPEDPYIVIRSKGKLMWGYGPGKTTADRVVAPEYIRVAAVPSSAKMAINGRNLFAIAPAQGTKTLKVFDMLGNQILVNSFSGTSAQISLDKLPRGAMIAKLMSGEKVLATKAFKLK